MKRKKADCKDPKINPAHTLLPYKVEVISKIRNTPLCGIIKIRDGYLYETLKTRCTLLGNNLLFKAYLYSN
jgi:hypothetical protein